MAHGRPDFTYLADTDIIAQTIGSVAIDIAAQTLATLGINITAQDLAELVISKAAQTVGIYVVRDWASTQDENKSFTGHLNDSPAGTYTLITYTVPANKVDYIDEISFGDTQDATSYATILVKKDAATLWELDTLGATIYDHVFTTPLKFVANEVISVTITTVGSTKLWGMNLGGRELTA